MPAPGIHGAALPLRLGTVQQTLLVPLWARAMEAAEPEPLLRDPVAAELLSRLDFDFGLLAKARASQLGCCLRAALLDGWTQEFLGQHPDGSVVELGVGLNSRFERIDSGRGHFFAIDFEDVIALRQALFSPHERRTLVACDARSLSWVASVQARKQPVLILAEGVLVYLQEREVRELLTGLADRLPGALCAFDTMTAPVIWMQRFHDAMRHFEARFSWALQSSEQLCRWDPRFQVQRSEQLYELLYAHPQRLPPWMRLTGPLLARIWPGLRRCYQIMQLQLG